MGVWTQHIHTYKHMNIRRCVVALGMGDCSELTFKEVVFIYANIDLLPSLNHTPPVFNFVSKNMQLDQQ